MEPAASSCSWYPRVRLFCLAWLQLSASADRRLRSVRRRARGHARASTAGLRSFRLRSMAAFWRKVIRRSAPALFYAVYAPSRQLICSAVLRILLRFSLYEGMHGYAWICIRMLVDSWSCNTSSSGLFCINDAPIGYPLERDAFPLRCTFVGNLTLQTTSVSW